MYGKLIIFLTLAGCILIAAQTTSNESANSTSSSSKAASSSSESTNSTNNAARFANTTEIESTNSTTNATKFVSTEESESTNSTANATKAANATESESTNSTSTASNGSNTTTSGSTTSTNNATGGSGTGQIPAWFPWPIQPPSRPSGPGFNRPRNPQGIAGLPIISDFINAFRGIVPGHRHGPGGRRVRRSRASRALFDTPNITVLVDGQSLPGFPGIPNMSDFQIPNADDIVSEIPELSDPSDLQISGIPNLPRIPLIPGLKDAVGEARERVANEISPGEDVVTAIQDAIQNGLSSYNPTEAIRGLVSTILNAYLAVARNCPMLIVGGYVMREGLFLTSEILRTMGEISGQIQDAA